MADPTFDPTKPFTEAPASAPTFNPNLPFEEVGPAPVATTTPVTPPSTPEQPPKVPQVPSNDPLAQAATAGLPSPDNSPVQMADAPSTWGLDPKEYKDYLIRDGKAGKYAGTPLGLAVNVADYGVVPFQAMAKGAEWYSKELDALSKDLGWADLPKKVGIDQQFLPGSAIMAAGEAFPLGGMEVGILPTPAAAPKGKAFKLSGNVEAGLENLYKTGSKEDILSYAKKNDFALDETQLSEYIDYRDNNPEVGLSTTVRYQKSPEGAVPAATWEEAKVIRDRGDTPVMDAETARANKHMASIADEVNTTMEGWTNKSNYEIVNSVEDIADDTVRAALAERPTTKAFIGPGGTVRIIAKNVARDEVQPIVFHETLGHHGMSSLFQEGLDTKLVEIYNSSPDFRSRVDEWMNEHPGAYADSPSPVARAADEVLAEMSQRDGVIERTTMDKVKDYVKNTGRKLGIKMEYSDREVRSILGMAHDAVVNGEPSVAANGFRMSSLWEKDYRPDDPAVVRAAELFGISKDKIPKALTEADFRGQVFLMERDIANGVEPRFYGGANDNRIGLKDRPSHPGPDAPKEKVVEYHRKTAEWKLARARQWEQRGNVEKAARSRHDAFLEEYLAKRIDPSYELTDLDNLAYYRYQADYAKKRAIARAKKGDVAGSKRHQKEAEDYSSKAAKLAEKMLKGENIRFYGDEPYIKKSLTSEKMRTLNDVDDELEFLGKETENLREGPVSIPELQMIADDMGFTSSRYLRSQSLSDKKIAAKILGAKQALTDQVQELVRLRERVKNEGLSPSLKQDIQERLAVAQAVYARFDNDTAEVGRALRVLREVTESRKLGKAFNRFLEEDGGLDIVNNTESLNRFLDNIAVLNEADGPAAAANHIRKARKMTAEDYASSVIYNSMLSSPVTWAKNAVGSPMNYGIDLLSDTVTSVAGQAGRLTGAERVFGREVLARTFGPLMAFNPKNYNLYTMGKGLAEAFKTGNARDLAGTEGKLGTRRLVFSTSQNKGLRALGYVTETPQRILAVTDEFWARQFHVGNLYGEAARQAALEGLKGKDFWNKVSEYVNNPTPEMDKAALARTNRQLFRDHDKMSWLARNITKAQTPVLEPKTVIEMVTDTETGKTVPRMKQEVPADSALTRTGKFAFKVSVPFVPTLDSIARTVIRNTGPLALFSKDIRADIMAGGVRRQGALGRMATTSALMGMVAKLEAEGRITGVGDPDWKRQASQQTVTPPMSIKIGDEWVSYAGLDPAASTVAAAATASRRYRQKGQTTPPEIATALVAGGAQSLTESTYADSLMTFVEMIGETAETVKEGKNLGSSTRNLVVGQAANVANPSFVRWINQEFLDPAARDTTGDDSFTDRVVGRIKSGIPGQSTDLPQRYDVYGRPMENLRQPDYVETDPAVIELSKLADNYDKTLIGPVGPLLDTNGDGEKDRLNAEDYQMYQAQAGYYLREGFRALQQEPNWGTLSEEEKVAIVKDLYAEAKKQAKEDLWPEPEELEQ